MKIGILETGHVNPALVERHGRYPPMFERLFRNVEPGLNFKTYAILESQFPDTVTECDAWLVTGSKFGVYDPEPWIAPLKQFLRKAYDQNSRLIGVCFGHQILAEALGGRVEKSTKGWGAGVHSYTVTQAAGWAPLGWQTGDKVAVHAMHQDQVVEQPPEAVTLMQSDFCPFAAFAYGDPAAPKAISVQPHPEFEADYERDLTQLLRTERIPEVIADAALESIGTAVDNTALARWMTNFVQQKIF